MSKRFFITVMMLVFLTLTSNVMAGGMKPGEFLVLSYHAVVQKAMPGEMYSIPKQVFVEQMEYLRTHGYVPVSLDDILKAGKGEKALPKNPVLLTFDDAYISYYEFVLPILEKFGYPSLLSVVGSFIDNPPEGLPEELMSWDQIREVASNELVEIISHTYDLHKGIQYNPPGNVWAAGAILAYNPETETYETEGEYSERIENDFRMQEDTLSRYIGFKPRGLAWPYGKYTSIGIEIARKEGFLFSFTLENGFANMNNLYEINRNLILNEPIKEFIKVLKKPEEEIMVRAVQVDLDLIYDPDSYEKTDENLGKLIDRLVEMKVNTVFLQAFADPDGTGDIKSVYFHNRVLPVRADIFSHAAHQMIIRDIFVYAWLPTLSLVLPDKELNDKLRVREVAGDETRHSKSWYQRLTPFSDDVRKLVRQMYEDLAAHSQIHGILFQDDAYLTDYEDYHPLAVADYSNKLGNDFLTDKAVNDAGQINGWARYKTEVLIDFTKNLMEGVNKYRRNIKFARNIYSQIVTDPESEEWFAQNYGLFLDTYDQVVIMAYPQMEKQENPSAWLKELVKRAKEFPDGIEKTVFKIQSYNWDKKIWVKDDVLLDQLRDILASGGTHIAYYPDNVWLNRPALNVIKLEMSTKKYPFIRY